MSSKRVRGLAAAFLIGFLAATAADEGQAQDLPDRETIDGTVAGLVAAHGEGNRERIECGVGRAASLWSDADGSSAEFQAFCSDYFIADPRELSAALATLERNFEAIRGHMHQIGRVLRTPVDLDTGPLKDLDILFAGYSPSAHLAEDFFRNRIAFFVVLNFMHRPLQEKLRLGAGWNREEWAMARAGDMFTSRVPAELELEMAACSNAAQRYVYDYNIFMGLLLNEEMLTLFPEKLKLLEHWGLRDEIRGRYADPEGLVRQELIYRIMLRIIDQSIPASVVNNPDLYWEPHSNRVFAKQDGDYVRQEGGSEPDVRYAHLRRIFEMQRKLDDYHPAAPTLMDRYFNIRRQIPEEEVERLFVSVLSSPLAVEVGKVIAERLGRSLRPYDIWYNGFRQQGGRDETGLDAIVRGRYPDAAAFEADLPGILMRLGFGADKAAFLGGHIVVDPSRGSGHAMAAAMRGDKAHLRTRLPRDGMTYKGFNIATHELGHNVEQIFSLYGMDHYFLRGVPNSAFTEAIAIILQNRNLDALGLESGDSDAGVRQTLDTFWCAYESGGVALTEMRIWRWMYRNPGAAPAELKAAVMRIACEVWNEYFAPVIGVRDTPLLAVYAHMLSDPAYLPNYTLGHIILFQIEQYLDGRDLGVELERMCRLGSLTPQEWMRRAVGTGISTDPLLEETRKALDALKE